MTRPARCIVLDGTFEHFRSHARFLLAAEVAPAALCFEDPTRAPASGGLFGAPEPSPVPDASPSVSLCLPKNFPARLACVACHSDPTTWELLYRLLWRARPGATPRLDFDDVLDPDLAEFGRREKAVRRDAHKMHAFVRFRRVDSPGDPDGERFIAWHRPQHRIVAREGEFFRRRFPNMAWSILTEFGSVHWDGARMEHGPGVPRHEAPDADQLEDLWKIYYSSIFNPARVKLQAMYSEMPKHYWDTMPETELIPQLLREVPDRLAAMASNSRAVVDSAAPYVPADADLPTLAVAAKQCAGCDLCHDGTQVVFGEGPATARIVLIGEQPGDEEERVGRPFVGPAGQVLNAALEAAGLDRGDLYLTNAVKHFHHRTVEPEPRFDRPPQGKRRLHSRPNAGMVSRCQPWLDAEIRKILPPAVVCLGATAGKAVFGPQFRLKNSRGVARSSRYAPHTVCTYHPAAILRASSPEEGERMRAALVDDLRRAAAWRRGST